MSNIKQIDHSILHTVPRELALKLIEIIRALSSISGEEISGVYDPSDASQAGKDIKTLKELIEALPGPKSYDKEIAELKKIVLACAYEINHPEYRKSVNDLERKIIAGIYEVGKTTESSSQYETIFIPAGAMTSTAASGATYLTFEYVTNDINVNFLEFDSVTEEYAEFQFPMPEQWDLGTIKAKFYWTSTVGSTAGDTVEFEIQAGAISNDDAIDAALGTSQVISDTLLANNGADLQITDATPEITVGGTPALGDMIHFKVSRNVGGTDNMTEDAWLLGCLIQYKANKTVTAW